MKNNLKKKIIIIASVIIGLSFILFTINAVEKLINKPSIVISNDKELKTIDSLMNVVSMQDEIIQQLKDSVVIVEKIVIKKVNKIKEIPMTENIVLLKDNLICHGELTNVEDTLPALVKVDNDTLAILSENNLKDVNIIVAKYEGELNKNLLLNDIIYNDSLTISLKNNIIDSKNAIIMNQEQTYNAMKSNLEVALNKEKREKTYWIIGGVAATSLLTGYILLK